MVVRRSLNVVFFSFVNGRGFHTPHAHSRRRFLSAPVISTVVYYLAVSGAFKMGALFARARTHYAHPHTHTAHHTLHTHTRGPSATYRATFVRGSTYMRRLFTHLPAWNIARPDLDLAFVHTFNVASHWSVAFTTALVCLPTLRAFTHFSLHTPGPVRARTTLPACIPPTTPT